MPKKQHRNAIMIVRLYNHNTGDDVQFEVSETMLYACNKIIQELFEDYKTRHAGHDVMYLDFHQGYDYPKGGK